MTDKEMTKTTWTEALIWTAYTMTVVMAIVAVMVFVIWIISHLSGAYSA